MQLHDVSELTPASAITEIAAGDHWIIFWEEPVRSILRRIQRQESSSSEELLRLWIESASDILKEVRRHRKQVTLINLAEAQQCPEALTRFCKERYGIQVSVMPSELNTGAEVIPVFQKITRHSIKDLQILLQELEASSVPLDSLFETESSSQWLPASALFAALDSVRRLEHNGVLKEQLLATERQVETSRSKLAEQRELIDQKDQELSRAEEIALEKHEVLLTELQQAFQESEDYFEKWKLAEGAAEEKERVIQESGHRIVSLEAEHKIRLEENLRLTADLENHKALLQQSEEKSLRDCEMLLRELREAFRESELYFKEWKKTEILGNKTILNVESVTRCNLFDRGSHRHLDYMFHGVEMLCRSWQTLRVRLVRHRGYPGILLFEATHSNIKPLYEWKVSGNEGGRDYLLLVPATDAPARDLLRRAPASDLLFIRNSVSLMLADLKLNGAPAGASTNWVQVAERLLEQINAIPERLHYDAVRATIATQERSDPLLTLEVINPCFRDFFASGLKLKLSKSSLLLGIAGDAIEPWPDLGGGGVAREHDLLLGGDSPEEAKKLWNALCCRDRDLLYHVIEELPNFLVHAAEQLPTHRSELAALGRRVGSLKRKAARLSGNSLWSLSF